MNTKEIEKSHDRSPAAISAVYQLPCRRRLRPFPLPALPRRWTWARCRCERTWALYAARAPRVGYDRAELTTCLEDCLGGRPVAAVIVGAGKLGRALLDYAGFSEYGTNILAAFRSECPGRGRPQ